MPLRVCGCRGLEGATIGGRASVAEPRPWNLHVTRSDTKAPATPTKAPELLAANPEGMLCHLCRRLTERGHGLAPLSFSSQRRGELSSASRGKDDRDGVVVQLDQYALAVRRDRAEAGDRPAQVLDHSDETVHLLAPPFDLRPQQNSGDDGEENV